MPTYKVSKVRYTYNGLKTSTQHLSVQGNTEGAVKARLQKKHPGKEIVILEIIWA